MAESSPLGKLLVQGKREISVCCAKIHEEFGLRHREVKVPAQNARRHDTAYPVHLQTAQCGALRWVIWVDCTLSWARAILLSFFKFLNCSPFPTQLLAEKTSLTRQGMLKTSRYCKGGTRGFYWGENSSLISQGRMAMLKMGCSTRSLLSVCLEITKSGRGLTERKMVL